MTPSILSKNIAPLQSFPHLSFLFTQKIAHRGLHGFLKLASKNQFIPENSLAAFNLAISNHYAIEFDVRLLADRHLVVFHDHNTKRLTNISKSLKKISLSELQNLQLATPQNIPAHSIPLTTISLNHKSPIPLSSLQIIPTLTQVLNLIAGRTPTLIELKSDLNVNYQKICQQTFLALSAYQANFKTTHFAIQSFDPRIIRWFKRYHPEIPVGLLLTSRPQISRLFGLSLLYSPFYALFKPDFLSVDKKLIRSPILQSQRQSTPLLCWTINSENEQKNYQTFFDNSIFDSTKYLPSSFPR